MKNDDRILELLAESLKGQDRIVAELKGTNERLDRSIERLDRLDIKVDKIEGQLIKLNIQTVENTRAIFQLAEKVEMIADLHNRVSKLEKTVYK
ncbi:MAG: hypothetical protein WD824_19630 [Cyclobacteriaceae bacterium]